MTNDEVLVIDDNEQMRETLKLLLEDEGYTVNICAGGRSALARIKENHFGIYLIDYRMPEMNGDVVTAEVRKLHPDSFIVGFSIEPKEQTFLAAGADKFLVKDHLVNELVPLIRERKHRLTDQ